MIRSLLLGDAQADRVVPPTGFTAQLTVFASAAMAFLAVFALALSLASGRLADRWNRVRLLTIGLVAVFTHPLLLLGVPLSPSITEASPTLSVARSLLVSVSVAVGLVVPIWPRGSGRSPAAKV